MYASLSRPLAQIPFLDRMLGQPVQVVSPRLRVPPPGCLGVVGWGRKESALRGKDLADRWGLPFLALEDGFLRSVEQSHQHPPLSIVVDDLGIYYHCTSPSRLEALIARPLSFTEQKRSETLRQRWCEAGVSKYNHARDGALPCADQPFVLLVDQTRGDCSIRDGGACEETFAEMVAAALADFPQHRIVIKTHPDVFSHRQRKFGNINLDEARRHPQVHLLATDQHPAPLLRAAEAVYVVTSQMGFEALLWGTPVYTFGMPFYAGWGLTQDRLAAPEWRKSASLSQLIHAALVDYPRYRHPLSGEPCQVEVVLEHIALQRQYRQRFPERLYASGFSRWKQPIVRRFCQGSHVTFLNKKQPVPPTEPSAGLVTWGAAAVPTMTPPHWPVIRLEDGFLRSVGLGAELIAPLSWVMDARGLYYDARSPSELEHLLSTFDCSPALTHRAANLRQTIVEAGLSKYNVGHLCWQRPEAARRVLLVPGQVESDASLRYGGPPEARNLHLLQTVRAAFPDDWVIYKPHPDVRAGLRAAGDHEDQAAFWCDEVIGDVPMAELLTMVDEVHTFTSLTGFEALLRGKTVVCYGTPFYSGWGLTVDRQPCLRRQRRLSLEALIAGVLILYPTYVSRRHGCFLTAEQAVEELINWRNQPPSPPRQNWRQRVWRGLLGTLARMRGMA